MKLFAALGLAAGLLISTAPAFAQAADAQNTLVIQTDKGEIDVALRPDLAPKHVEQIKALAREGFYNGVVFHRVIDGFMAQTGDPTGTGMGGSDKPDLKAEFSKETFARGTVGMARSSNPNSANSQFFIMLADGPFLDGQYTVVGKVTKGMDVVDKIKKGDANANGTVQNPDKMVSVKVASDPK
ncbi:peptidylprolyl isomerase [Aureimonas jatrophae]|uniref:Peptidyl-prolyl cis-trans isomerase n=1 Tax=Aureimonas jatrophae TaxID=1166073 RepID=A0A1H0MFL1_9HYPH|nr:peptidylprolyl isomerase [Aureimonas jatrophae]MBB3951073.1 peptidylprolyl isomerase [Aureimonas jatrophae]SDO79095.1 peptidylprolyl isomerase [Aureimonas jatrophae]